MTIQRDQTIPAFRGRLTDFLAHAEALLSIVVGIMQSGDKRPTLDEVDAGHGLIRYLTRSAEQIGFMRLPADMAADDATDWQAQWLTFQNEVAAMIAAIGDDPTGMIRELSRLEASIHAGRTLLINMDMWLLQDAAMSDMEEHRNP